MFSNIPVICDLCSLDYTGDTQTKGGIVVSGYGVCPVCTLE